MSRTWTWQRWLPRVLDRNEKRASRTQELEGALAKKLVEADRHRVQLERLTEETLKSLSGERP